MQKTALCRVSATGLMLFIFLVSGGMFIPSAVAAVKVGDNLSLFGDFRMRYEIDDEHRSAGKDRDRDRARIRARFGFKYDWSDRISFGLRLRTESDSNQSPHQTLGLLNGGTTGSEDFGLDRAHIDFKILDGGFLWLGKHAPNFWQQNEAFWDGDIQPEGAGFGYNWALGKTGHLTLQGLYTYILDNGFSSNNGIFDDDTGTLLQGIYSRTMGTYTLTIASGALFISDNNAGTDQRGGSTTYTITSLQIKTKAIPNIPIKIGFDFLISSYDDSSRDPGDISGTGVSDANQGFVINLAAKYKKWSFKVEHYNMELNSVPLQGALGQDDFRYSTNFRGQKFQVGYDFGRGLSIDVRAYPQSIIDDSVVDAAGIAQTVTDSTRYQANLNIKF